MATTRHEEIAECLTEDILRGRYRPGERLPSERDLATRFMANRGAVREAVKKLEQLGLADVQPGGARVRAVEESSLDVLGHLLRLDDYPDADLVEQIMEVMEALIAVAVRRAISNASGIEIDEARQIIARVLEPGLAIGELIQARMNLWRHFMRMSGSLVLTLIGRSLRVQIMKKSGDRDHELLADVDLSGQKQCLRWLDQSLAERNSEGAVSALHQLTELNKRTILPVLARAHQGTVGKKEVAFQ